MRHLRLTVPAIAIAVSLLASGCGTDRAGRDATSVIRITERDFKIQAPARVPAGELVLSVRNAGPDDHELIVVRRGDVELPLRADGVTVDEEAVEPITAGALEPGEPEHTRELRVRLPPGRYELICNMSGHYLGGMHARLVVG